MTPYYTVVIPFVPAQFRTEWHPDKSEGPFKVLTRGNFATLADAIHWASGHLNGTPYSIRCITE